MLKRPDLFSAYVGIGQVANMRENERISYEHSAQMMPWEEPGKTLASLITYVRPLVVKSGKRGTKGYTAP
ncbi:hypothetical protein SAMN05518865_101588 [Duganella sp. CF458]|nr:hypothetical protein SAMN05518865_101588 [Duganella sp. CF458]